MSGLNLGLNHIAIQELKIARLEITFPKFPIMVIGDHDFLPIKQKSGRSDSKTIATTY